MIRRVLAPLLLISVLLAACDGDDEPAQGSEWVADIRAAVDAVDDELGGPQEYFEVTANPQLTNVFVAAEEATEAIPYLYVDGRLEPPGPPLTASGQTFDAESILFDEDQVLSRIVEELPASAIDGLSVEGGPEGSVRYVAAVRSDQGGVLEVVVAADGAILSVAPR